MEKEFEFRDILSTLRRNFRFIVLITVLATLIGAALSYFVLTPIYQGKTDLLISHTVTERDNSDLSLGKIETNLKLIESYEFIIQSQLILDKAANKLGGTYTTEELRKKLEIKTNGDSQILSIMVEDPDLETASNISRTIAETFQSEVKEIIGLDNIHILSVTNSNEPAEPIRPNGILYSAICFLIGLTTSVGIIFMKDYFFAKIDSQADISNQLSLMPLGEVPILKHVSNKKKEFYDERFHMMVSHLEGNSPIMEAYRLIRTNIQFHSSAKSLKSILFTSANPGEGKSVTCGNLAILMAMDGKKTVFVDCDLRKPTGNFLFNLPNRGGVTSYLTGNANLTQILQTTTISNLSFIASGPVPSHPPELLASSRMDQLLTELSTSFDIIILDCPPMIVSDPAILAAKVDGCIFVISSQKNRRERIKQQIDQLKRIETNIVGVILNKASKRQVNNTYYYDY